MGAGIGRGGVLLLSLMGSSCGPTATAPPVQEPPPATVVPPPSVAPVSSTEPSAASSPERGTMLHPWLHLELPWGGGLVGVFELDEGLAVVVPAQGEGTARRAFMVDRESIVEEPRLLQSLPAGPVVGLSGDWPRRARIVVDVDPAGHHCTRSFDWKGGRWLEDPSCKTGCCLQNSVAWNEPVGKGIRLYRTPWGGDRVLWESLDSSTGRSTFYEDPNAKVRSKTQRARCAQGAANRLKGRFSGTALPSGAVLTIGSDCQTAVATVERWAPGADRPEVHALPGAPKMAMVNAFAGFSAAYAVQGADLYVSLYEDVGHKLPRPYVAHFDGSTWRQLPFANQGQSFGLHSLKDGSVWIATHDGGRWRLWRHPGAGRTGSWTDETPTGIFSDGGEEFYDTRVGPEGRLWFLGIDALGVRTDESWTIYRMPPADPKQGSMPLVRPQAVHWTPWTEPVVSGSDERRFLLLRPVERAAGPLR